MAWAAGGAGVGGLVAGPPGALLGGIAGIYFCFTCTSLGSVILMQILLSECIFFWKIFSLCTLTLINLATNKKRKLF